jgi:hypothetical protein
MKPTPAQDEAFLNIVCHGGIAAAAEARCGDLSALSKLMK